MPDAGLGARRGRWKAVRRFKRFPALPALERAQLPPGSTVSDFIHHLERLCPPRGIIALEAAAYGVLQPTAVLETLNFKGKDEVIAVFSLPPDWSIYFQDAGYGAYFDDNGSLVYKIERVMEEAWEKAKESDDGEPDGSVSSQRAAVAQLPVPQQQHGEAPPAVAVDPEEGRGKIWKVVGGRLTGGIPVQLGEESASQTEPELLATGSLIQVDLDTIDQKSGRLYFSGRISGSGPSAGWLTFKAAKKRGLVVPTTMTLADVKEEMMARERAAEQSKRRRAEAEQRLRDLIAEHKSKTEDQTTGGDVTEDAGQKPEETQQTAPPDKEDQTTGGDVTEDAGQKSEETQQTAPPDKEEVEETEQNLPPRHESFPLGNHVFRRCLVGDGREQALADMGPILHGSIQAVWIWRDKLFVVKEGKVAIVSWDESAGAGPWDGHLEDWGAIFEGDVRFAWVAEVDDGDEDDAEKELFVVKGGTEEGTVAVVEFGATWDGSYEQWGNILKGGARAAWVHNRHLYVAQENGGLAKTRFGNTWDGCLLDWRHVFTGSWKTAWVDRGHLYILRENKGPARAG